MANISNYNSTIFPAIAVGNDVELATAQYKTLSTDDKLGLLWIAYTEIGRSITPAAPGAARLELAAGLLDQIKQMSYDEQLQTMRDLVEKRNTPVTRAYGVFTTNTKLGFWYVLAQLMDQKIVVPVPAGYQLSRDAKKAFETITLLEMSQQITVLRNAAAEMGVDPLF
ncbi:Orange carotenoid-binding protein [Thalassoporum mexicanum PCC 7367]|uniref:orange carotenoid protein N-terminal domain-containing protein n=1 Tax=Thalassoporum mexicanum TaxID=3457544 RepID=UPI00029FA035|nr:orange carotenoid protein N-terminal domain-containing protein [Pseudanabaena sp. PCC 7367]AFY70731.1 Orange carotenoid-binding protein [Pseudanabaena sp. PCC 7367]